MKNQSPLIQKDQNQDPKNQKNPGHPRRTRIQLPSERRTRLNPKPKRKTEKPSLKKSRFNHQNLVPPKTTLHLLYCPVQQKDFESSPHRLLFSFYPNPISKCLSGICTSRKSFFTSLLLNSCCTSYSPCTRNSCFTCRGSWQASHWERSS